jgi:hypothetical protein
LPVHVAARTGDVAIREHADFIEDGGAKIWAGASSPSFLGTGPTQPAINVRLHYRRAGSSLASGPRSPLHRGTGR